MITWRSRCPRASPVAVGALAHAYAHHGASLSPQVRLSAVGALAHLAKPPDGDPTLLEPYAGACMCSPRRLPLPTGDSTLLEPYAGALLARQSLQGLGDTEWVVRAATCSTLGLLTGAAWRAVVGALLPMIEDVYASVRARARR